MMNETTLFRRKLQNGHSLIMGDYYKSRFLDLMDEHLVKTDR